ncbi:MAG: MmcQ/YjbR family DNA-binding protein [Planctomycetes bacterium]|nr:MmcQ/YjbR family DNA-binding protein [Planctomycetota bacterium]
MVSGRQFRALALAFDGAIEGAHMDHPDFRAGGRIFASLHPDGHRAMVKLSPPQQQRWLANPSLGSALAPASGAWGRAGCTMLELAAVDAGSATDLLTEAWQNALAAPSPRATRKKSEQKKSNKK